MYAKASTWMSYALCAAAIYNLLWGAFAVLFPASIFRWLSMPEPKYPEMWQCIGMIVGVYGVGYAIAALDPIRHWPIVLVGLLGKVLGPIGFLNAALQRKLPWRFGWINVANDLIWWVPFGLILLAAYRANRATHRTACPEIRKMALRARTQYGTTLIELPKQSPLLFVFLRHAGCTFCREALTDLATQRGEIEANGAHLVLIHMGSEEQAAGFLARYGLAGVARVSDPERRLYKAFGLGRGSLLSLFGPKVLWRAFVGGSLQKHGFGAQQGDGFQMPGIFLLYHGEVLRSYLHRTAADRPNYVELTSTGTLTV